METIGQRMSYLMRQKGVSNIEMASLLNVDPSYIAKFKTDARRPNTLQIDKIAIKLNTTTDYLLGNEASGLPFYSNFFNGIKEGISLMSGLSNERNFCLYNEWNTINDIKKNDLLVFSKTNDAINKVVIVSYNNKELMLGRLQDNILFFDNGIAPLDISNKDKYVVLGKLTRIVRYFN